MLCRADSIGVFQVESRAQMSMLPRLKPRTFYDLVIEVAIVRPGPIQGDMVHPYLRRRDGIEPVEFPSDELREVLGKTLGVPLFQEQAMKIAIVAAGFTPAEADGLRRSMAAFRRSGQIERYHAKLVEGMVARGYERDFAEACFRQIEGFGYYGFPESHAASFALLVYVSAWLKCHYPDVFCAAILNAQPMGFYAPAQLVRDAVDHGVEVREVDVNHSHWDTTLEPRQRRGPLMTAVRLGFRQVKGLGEQEAQRLVAARLKPYRTLEEIRRRAGVRRATLVTLAEADAFRSLGLDRRQALWAVQALKDQGLPLFDHAMDARPARLQPAAARGRRRALARAARDGPGRAGARGLRHLAPVPEGPPPGPPARLADPQARHHRPPALARRPRPPGHRLRPGPGPPAPRQRQGRHLRHPRGRDRLRQPRPLAQPLRAVPRHRHDRPPARRHRHPPARGPRHPRHRRAPDRPHARPCAACATTPSTPRLLDGAMSRADEFKREPRDLRDAMPEGRNFR